MSCRAEYCRSHIGSLRLDLKCALKFVQEMRLVERKDKNNSVLVIGFAEFSDAHRANVALKALQVF